MKFLEVVIGYNALLFWSGGQPTQLRDPMIQRLFNIKLTKSDLKCFDYDHFIEICSKL